MKQKIFSILGSLLVALLVTNCATRFKSENVVSNNIPIQLEVWSSDTKLLSGVTVVTNEKTHFHIGSEKEYKYIKCEDDKKVIYTKKEQNGLLGLSTLEGNMLYLTLNFIEIVPIDDKFITSLECVNKSPHLIVVVVQEIKINLKETKEKTKIIGNKYTGEYLLKIINDNSQSFQ